MKHLNKKLLTVALALAISLATMPSVNVQSEATGFDPNSVGGTGSNSIPAWKAVNPDVRGWIRIPGTNVNWPVVVGKDNLYYNNLDYYKNQNKDGVIWADSDSKFGKKNELSKNTVLYGHNWENYSANPRKDDPKDTMFGQVTAYHHLDYAQAHPYIHYSTEDENMTWVVFAAFYTDTNFSYNESNPDDARFGQIVGAAKSRSRHDFDVEVSKSDKIITLSTCTRTYGQRDDQRFVVMARLLRDGEQIKEIKITENKDFTPPKFK